MSVIAAEELREYGRHGATFGEPRTGATLA
jgi:hypothetical protein